MAGSHNTAGDAYAYHSSGLRKSTRTYLASELHKRYPEHEISVVNVLNCDIIEFAKDKGLKFEQDFSDGYFQMYHEYVEPKKRLGKDGKHEVEEEFSKYHLAWSNATITLYKALCYQDCDEILHWFIVYPRDQNLRPTVEDLVKQATIYSNRINKEVWVFDDGCWHKSKSLYESVQNSHWDDVVLPAEAKEAFMQDTASFFDSSELYDKFKIPWKRGVILHGPPGNGKTITIKALMRTLAERPEPVPTLYVKSFFHAKLGSRHCIRSIFDVARRKAPCMLVLEDLDSLVAKDIRSYFLNEVDGVAGNDGILLIGTTNHLEKLDPAIAKRPSRFDRKIPFADPSEDARVQYAKHWMIKLDATPDLKINEDDCKTIATLTDKFSFAYMQEAFVAALRTAMIDNGSATGGSNSTELGKKSFMDCFSQNVGILREQMVAVEEEQAAEEAKEKKENKGEKGKKDVEPGEGNDDYHDSDSDSS